MLTVELSSTVDFQCMCPDCESNHIWLIGEPCPPMCRDQKLHWSSVDGSMQGTGGIELRNRGDIRFAKRGPDACHVTITFEFEVPGPLVPVASALTPFGNSVLMNDMQKFATFAQQQYSANGDALPAAPQLGEAL